MSKNSKKIILVTGASRGVGKGIAEGIGSPGDVVICAARSLASGTQVHQFGFELSSSLEDTVKNINQDNINADAYVVDLNKTDEIEGLAKYVEKKYGRLDILVHSACQIHDDLVQPKPFWEKSVNLWSIVDVGLRSNYLLSHALAPLMIKNPESLIVQISSHGASCYMHGPIYGAQKAGVDKMAFDMAHDLKEFQVCSISLWSGIVKDEKTAKVSAQHGEHYAEFLKGAASQLFAGKVIKGIFEMDNKMKLSGKTLIAAEIGAELGITNEDGSKPKSDRDTLGGPQEFNKAVIY